ncbi:MAG: adenylosuccinate synthetase [Candidatus Dojkabacteria bacterium]|nr:adenylosuccinate synthetase [Candidatus Dojkabacteria bacterium]
MTNLEKSLNKKGRRANSVAVIGAIFGDEGKGRITDELTSYFLKKYKKVVVYRDNGGSNAGHTISMNGKKIGLHQIGSGILHKGCTVVLGKGMVIHPIDLINEIEEVKTVFELKELPARLMVDEMATLNLDTHRAFELALKNREQSALGSQAATGRGMAPSYADILYRVPVRVRDLMNRNWRKIIGEHYDLYNDWISGMGMKCSQIQVKRFGGKDVKIGSKEKFLDNLEKSRNILKDYVYPMYEYIKKEWNSSIPFIFEKAQAVGLDYRWGVYPDVSVSNCCLDGITYATEGVVNANDISARFGVIKSTYTSSVGKRQIPTFMEEKYATILRDDANEYGTTTGRPRDIAYLDLEMLKYFCRVGGIEELVFTHMDIIYKRDVKICIGYTKNNNKSYYRPDQEHLNNVKPVYKRMKYWNKEELKNAEKYSNVKKEVKDYIDFVSNKSNTIPVMLTFGPDRDDSLLI